MTEQKSSDGSYEGYEELTKAKFYYDSVLKLEELSQKSNERINSKINVFIGVLSTIIPILTGIGYAILSSVNSVSFFVFYLISLSMFVWSLATCVHLLSPKWFTCIDIGRILKKHDKKKLSYAIFKVSSKWESIIKRNFNTIGNHFYGLKRTARLIIVGLTSLVFAFLQLGIEYYLLPVFSVPPYSELLSVGNWRVITLLISAFIFVLVVKYYLVNKQVNRTVNAVDVQDTAFLANSQSAKPKGADMDSLFRIALILLGIISAAVFQFNQQFGELSTFAYSVRITTLPYMILVIAWIIKELLKEWWSFNKIMAMTEFCWDLWTITLFYYAVSFINFGSSNPLSTFHTGLLLIPFILLAVFIYLTNKRIHATEKYYHSNSWALFSILLFALTYIFLVFLIFPFELF